jgi:hypothetical protein
MLYGVGARPDEIAHCFARSIRHPYGRHVAGAQQPRQFHGVEPVCLDSLARLARNRARRDDSAGMPRVDDLPLKSITARAASWQKCKLRPSITNRFSSLPT